jgi:hypothetical protein
MYSVQSSILGEHEEHKKATGTRHRSRWARPLVLRLAGPLVSVCVVPSRHGGNELLPDKAFVLLQEGRL